MKAFASDNYSGIHPDILTAIIEANTEHEISYGDDSYSEEARNIFKQHFGNVEVLFAFNGTGADRKSVV